MPTFPNSWVLYFYKLSDWVASPASSSPSYNEAPAPLHPSGRKSPSWHLNDNNVDHGTRRNITHEGTEREGRTRKHKVGVGGAEKSLWVEDSSQAQSEGLSSFLLDLSSWFPNSWTSTSTSGCQTGGLGNNEGGKHHRGWNLNFSWPLSLALR